MMFTPEKFVNIRRRQALRPAKSMREKMKPAVAVVFTIAALLSAPVSAEGTRFEHETSFFGSWDKMREPVDGDTTLVSLRYGRYFSPRLLGTLASTLVRTESGAFESSTSTMTLGVKYYVSLPQSHSFVPFVDANFGTSTTDTGNTSESGVTWELGGGLSFFFTDATSIDAALHFYQTETDIEQSGTRLTFGITTRF